MAQPTPYVRQNDFSNDESNAVGGRSTVRTAAVDAELDALGLTANQTRVNLGLIQRDDGKLRDGVTQLHTLAPDVRALLTAGNVKESNLRGDWATATAYVLLDVVAEDGNTYICSEAHTSGTFATDLAAGRWVIISYGAGLSDTVDTTGGAGAVGYNPALAYAAGTVGFALNSRKAVFGTGVAAVDDAAIQAAIDAAPVMGVIDLFGTVASSTAKVLKPQLMIRNGGGAIINHTNASTNCFQYLPPGPLDGFPGQITLEGLQINGPGAPASGEALGTLTWSNIKAGVFIDANCPFVRLVACDIRGFFAGVVLRNCYCSQFLGGYYAANRHCIMLYGECHNTSLVNPTCDGSALAATTAFMTALSINYGAPAGKTGLMQSVSTLGGVYQRTNVGIWLENCQGFSNGGRIYFEENRQADMVIGVNDALAYARSANFTSIYGANVGSACPDAIPGGVGIKARATGCNINIQHSSGVHLRAMGHYPGSGAPTNRPILFIDGACGPGVVEWDTLTGTGLFDLDDPKRVTIGRAGGQLIDGKTPVSPDLFYDTDPLDPYASAVQGVSGEAGRDTVLLGKPIKDNVDIFMAADASLAGSRAGLGALVGDVLVRWLVVNGAEGRMEFIRPLSGVGARAVVGQLNAIPTIASAATIAPAEPTSFVSGTTTIDTITLPTGFPTGGRLTLIPTGVWSTSTSGNIDRAVVATLGEPITFAWDGAATEWIVDGGRPVGVAIPTIASAATIAPTTPVTLVSGTAAIATITVPAGWQTGERLTLVPTAAWTTTTAGNIHRAVTAVSGQPIDFVWDGVASKWYVKT